MSDLIQKILDDRAVIRAFSDEQIEILRGVLMTHIAALQDSQSGPQIQPAAPEVKTKVVETMQNMYVAYVDGSCSGNPGPGGWAAWFPGTSESLVGGSDDTTNNQMEIIAATKAIEATPVGAQVEIITDSMLVVETMSGKWARKSNIELWKALDAARASRHVTFRWVKGHNGHAGNEKANALAQAETIRRKEALARSAA